MSRALVIEPDRIPSVRGVETPSEFYAVLKAPGRLAGMRQPDGRTPWQALWNAGYRHVVCLTDNQPSYDPAPLYVLHAVELQDLYGGILPDAPEEEAEKIAGVVEAVRQAIRGGQGVIVHCAGGTGRTGTVIGAVLCRLGMRGEDAARHLDDVNRLRGTHWPESAWQREILRRFEDRV